MIEFILEQRRPSFKNSIGSADTTHFYMHEATTESDSDRLDQPLDDSEGSLSQIGIQRLPCPTDSVNFGVLDGYQPRQPRWIPAVPDG